MSIQFQLKNACQDFFIESWKPLKRTEGNHIFKDALVAEGNLRKIGARTYQIGMAVLLGANAAIFGTVLMISFPVASSIAVIGAGVAACTGWIAWYATYSLGDELTKHLVDGVLAKLGR